MSSIVSVSPFDCRMWKLHDRLDAYITEETCRAEIESFLKHGQVVPALGRPLKSDPNHKIELIYGARRLFIARHINKPLLVELRDLSDKEAIIAMDVENRQRQDISPYERGLSFSRWLQDGYFDSQDNIARMLGISASQVSRLIKITKLPKAILSAFGSPSQICETWGLSLVEALENDAHRQLILKQARIINAIKSRPAPEEVFRQLLSACASGRKVPAKSHDEVIHACGAPLIRVRRGTQTISLALPTQRISMTLLTRICNSIVSIMEEEKAVGSKGGSFAIHQPNLSN